MKGHILLEGGAEFGGGMKAPDLRALALAGGPGVLVSIIPTAAAPDHNDQRAGRNGVRWFNKLGAVQVTSVPLIDRASANDAAIVEALKASRLIYLLGGFPQYLAQTLLGSRAWQAMLDAYQAGAVLGGSSAGAMVLCQHYFDPDSGSVQNGLNLIPGAIVAPHHNQFGRDWVSRLRSAVPNDAIIGIDEQTGLIDDAPQGGWTVYGKGAVTVYRGEKIEVYKGGQVFVKDEG